MVEKYSTKAFEMQYTYLGDDLGSTWGPNQTGFRLWAPTADEVNVCLYQTGTDGADDCFRVVPMQRSSNGTWIAAIEGDLNGVYYTYAVHREGKTVDAIDPYARATGVNGKRAMVVNLLDTNPEGWEQDSDPNASLNITDCVIYELHVRDLSSAPGSGIQAKGKYLGLTETGTQTSFGRPTGIDHIKALGITHIHLLPVYDFGSVDENDLENKQFNWGYDPVNYNVPEGSYSTNPYDGFVRIRELKQAIHALHESGISVILDVVYNHVYHTYEFSMNQIVPGYFSREDENGALSNGSGCGNDTASERTMVRKFIVDSVNYWADEYHVDGFRFDLVGLLDTATINEIVFTVKKKHPNVIFYGEGWDIQTKLTKPDVSLTIQKNARLVPNFAFFNDSIRDTLRGSVFDYHAKGYISGAEVSKEHLMHCFAGITSWSDQPKQIVNYVSCHDNHTLYDRIAEALPYAEHEELARRSRLAAAFNLLSAGTPFFQAGEELLRTKKSRPGVYVGDSYRSPDRINSIKWNSLKDKEVWITSEYYKGLIAIRKKYDAFRNTLPATQRSGYSLLPAIDSSLTAFRLEGNNVTIICAFLAGMQSAELDLPDGVWEVHAEGSTASASAIRKTSGKVSIPPLSAMVLVHEK